MARWDDLRRAILANDPDGTERIWFELIEADPKDPGPFLEAADLQARQPGGRRFASSLLGLLADVLEEKERWAALLPVLGRLAAYTPDDAALREKVVLAATRAYPGRPDLEVLLEQSGVRGGAAPGLEDQIASLTNLLQIEKGAWVFHRSGWGVGQVVEYHPERGRCVIDFRTRQGHEMDVEAAARLLERLDEDDIRVQAVQEPRGLRKRAKEEPLVMLRQVLARYGGAAPLRNVREALIPDAVAASSWSTWWKEAKKRALLDPRFDVGAGRDPRVEFHDIPQADFQSQVDRALLGQATSAGRQKALRDLAAVMGGNEEARPVLVAAAQKEAALARSPVERVGWLIVKAEMTGEDPGDRLVEALAQTADPVEIVSSIPTDATRGQAARALLRLPEGGPEKLVRLALRDDPEAARVAAQELSKAGRPELFEDLLDRVEARPAQYPALYAWFCRGLRRGRWHGRTYEPLPLMLRILKVADAVEYRGRRRADPKDKAAVAKLLDLLVEGGCRLAEDASRAADDASAGHLHTMLGQNRALRARARQRLQDVVVHQHPDALRHVDVEAVAAKDAAAQAIYMTADGILALRARFERIANEEIPATAAEIARAREFGDLSENAEYHAAREKHALLKAKADALRAELSRAVAIKPEIVRTDAVSVGSRVSLRDATGEETTYTLFGPPDADVGRGIINYLTPLGQALMGQAEGDTVRLEVAGQVRELEVLRIENGLA